MVEVSLPGWIYDLKALAPVATTLVTVATNPVQFLRGPVLQIVIDALVLRPVAWVYGYLLMGFDIIAGTIDGASGPITSPFRLIGGVMTWAITGVYDTFLGIIDAAGPAAPLVAVLLVAFMVVLVFGVIYAVVTVIPGSDAVSSLKRWY